MYSKILIPLDGSKTAEKVLPYARYLASRLKIPVELLAIVDIAELAAHTAGEKARFIQGIIEEQERSSKEYLHNVATTFGDRNVQCSVEKGRADEVIIEKGERDTAMLIAIATHGRSGLNRFLLGSIAEKVLRGAANPLLLVRAIEESSDAEAAFTTMIVPLDGSDVAESVLPMAAGAAKKLGLEVILFRAYHAPFNAYAGDESYYAANYDDLISAVRDEAEEYLEKKVAEVKKLGVEKVSALAKEGFGGDEIISIGRTNPKGLIAMCSHGRSGVRRWVLGSVTENVVRHTVNPVLVTRPG